MNVNKYKNNFQTYLDHLLETGYPKVQHINLRQNPCDSELDYLDETLVKHTFIDT